jgi:hypothetical protein
MLGELTEAIKAFIVPYTTGAITKDSVMSHPIFWEASGNNTEKKGGKEQNITC